MKNIITNISIILIIIAVAFSNMYLEAWWMSVRISWFGF
jgi:hypothetical protein